MDKYEKDFIKIFAENMEGLRLSPLEKAKKRLYKYYGCRG